MQAAIQLVDAEPSGRRIREFTLRLVSERLTARELIAARVRQEVGAYNAGQGELFEGLVQPKGAEVALNGYRMKDRRSLDVDIQIETALTAFDRNGFFLLVDDRQIEGLDDVIVIGVATQVSFVKLVPLVGG
ncbi:MAG: hypothetical protein U0166_01350 [Acidobacteriota bacterium]